MSKINGKDVTVSIVVDSSPQEIQLIGCAQECSLITSTNLAGKSTIGSGKFMEFVPLSLSWTMSVNGFTTVDENMDILTLRGMQFSLLPVILSFKESTVTGDIYYSGFALIQSIQVTGNYQNAETYSVQFQGTGELLLDTNAVYGTYPSNVTAVLVSGPALLISWTPPAFPVPDSYTVRITDVNLNVTTYYPGITASNTTQSIDPDHNYLIAVQSVYDTLGASLFSPDINYP